MTGVQVVAGTALLSTLIYLAMVAEVFVYLKRRHNRVWRELGEPTPIPSTPTSIWRGMQFLFFGGFRQLWHDKNVRARLILIWIWLAVTGMTLFMAKSLGA
jgi:hypothetical protein